MSVEEDLVSIKEMLIILMERPEGQGDTTPSRSLPRLSAVNATPFGSGAALAGSGETRSNLGGKIPWAISHAEMLRYEKSGLLPIQRIS